MAIPWLEIYDTHINLIDQQHRFLVDMMNDLDSARGTANESKIIGELFYKLVDYTKYHFEQEENLMKSLKYPKLSEQINQHKGFVNKIVEMLEDLKEHNFYMGEKMNSFLTNWLIKHILGYDKEFAKFYNIVSK
jgi:hemerythrin-like metal-binding protein